MAIAIHKKPTLQESLERWWAKKFGTPSNSELFTSRTWFDLLVEYNLDVFEAKPLEVHRQADGEIQLKDTGDSLLDKWEQQLADNEDIDFMEAFGNEENYLKLQQKLLKAKEQQINYDYDQHMRDLAAKQMPRK